MGGKEHTLAFRHGLDGLGGPLIERVDLLQVRGRSCVDRRGGVRHRDREARAEVSDLDASALRRGPHVRVEAELGFLPRFLRRERPRGDVHAFVSAINRVGALGVRGTRVVDVGGCQDTRGDDHASLEAGGDDRIVEEVLEVHTGDRHDVGFFECRGLCGCHLVLVRGCIGGEQAGEAHGESGAVVLRADVTALSGSVGLVEGNIGRMSRDLGDVVADLRGRGNNREAVVRGGGRAGGQRGGRQGQPSGGYYAARRRGKHYYSCAIFGYTKL
ncbi:Uncharacterised protein [Mycobacteroides abscessus subsp. abscessus]|nr:Uncharacterised protein [Mycobacteroides abscessus subsp. abscessus]